MADSIKYFRNTFDACRPVYEVNYTRGTWRTVEIKREQYGDIYTTGRLRKPTDFTGAWFEEVPRPAQFHPMAA